MKPISATTHLAHPLCAKPPTWHDFLHLVETLVERSCCGGGVNAPVVHARPNAFSTLGRHEWQTRVASAPPRVAYRRGPFLLPDVTLASPGQSPTRGVDVRIDDGRITAIAPAGALEQIATTVIESLRGHVVAPALVDMHVHMPPDNALALTPLFMLLTLRHGVVRVRDAGDVDGTGTPAALRLVVSGALPGPEITYAYAFVGAGPARWANALTMERPEDADAIVAQLAHAGASWVKCYENLDAACIAALGRAAHSRGLELMGHVPTRLRHEEALIFDAQHYFGVPDPSTIARDHVLDRAITWSSVTRSRIDRVVAGCRAHGLVMTPTLSASKNLLRLEHHDEERLAADAQLLPRLYADVVWHPQLGLPAYRGITKAQFADARDAYERKLELTAALFEGDVPLHLGTDTQQPFVIPGTALHDELAAFEAAGVPRGTAWRFASEFASRALGAHDSGRLEVGARADVIVSPTNPMGTGWRPSAISAVIAGGALMFAADLDAAIVRERARFEGFVSDFVSRWLTRASLHRVARRFSS